MLCRNCGESIVDTAKFCPFCGVPQSIQPPSQPVSGETVHFPTPERLFEMSDVTVMLPRRRTNAPVAPAANRDEGMPSASTAPSVVGDKSAAHRSSARAIKVGGAAAIAIIAIAAVAFYANRLLTSAGKVGAPPVTAMQPTAPTPSAMHVDEPDAASANAAAPSIPVTDPVTAVKEAPVVEAPVAPEAAPQLPAERTVAPSKDVGQRKKGRAAATPPPPMPARVESAPPQPVAIESPAPALVATSPPAEPPKVERVACADSSNLFSREACLWQECAKPEFRSHAECARFTGPGGQK